MATFLISVYVEARDMEEAVAVRSAVVDALSTRDLPITVDEDGPYEFDQ